MKKENISFIIPNKNDVEMQVKKILKQNWQFISKNVPFF